MADNISTSGRLRTKIDYSAIDTIVDLSDEEDYYIPVKEAGSTKRVEVKKPTKENQSKKPKKDAVKSVKCSKGSDVTKNKDKVSKFEGSVKPQLEEEILLDVIVSPVKNTGRAVHFTDEAILRNMDEPDVSVSTNVFNTIPVDAAQTCETPKSGSAVPKSLTAKWKAPRLTGSSPSYSPCTPDSLAPSGFRVGLSRRHKLPSLHPSVSKTD